MPRVSGHTPILDAYDQHRLLRHLDRSGGAEACWPWKGATSGNGYGRMKVAGKLYLPHRLMAAVVFGNIDDGGPAYHGRVVMHDCDNPLCCNPKHLIVGNQKANVIDMDRKGRRASRYGHLIPDETIQAVRESTESSRVVAERLGISSSYVREVRRGEVRKAG